MKYSGIPSRISRRVQQLRRAVLEKPAPDEPPVSSLSFHHVVGLSAVIAFITMEVRHLDIGDAGTVFIACLPVLGILGLLTRGMNDRGVPKWVLLIAIAAAVYWFAVPR